MDKYFKNYNKKEYEPNYDIEANNDNGKIYIFVQIPFITHIIEKKEKELLASAFKQVWAK